mgnify:CR=1 FL=1
MRDNSKPKSNINNGTPNRSNGKIYGSFSNSKYLGSGYLDLKKALPLDMPISTMIEPTNQCNYRCTFCPTGDKSILEKFSRPKGFMSINLFKKIIDDINEMSKTSKSKIKSLLLFKDGEPLLHKDLPQMISYAKKKSASEFIAVTTNGALLDNETAHNLIESRLDVLRISMQSLTNKGYKEVTKTDYTIEEIRENIKNFFELKNKKKSKVEVIISYTDSGNLKPEEKEKYINDYKGITDKVYISPINGWSLSDEYDWRLGNARKEKRGPDICPDPFSKLAVNFNGTVSVCCVDWSHGTIVGDLNKESFYDVWNGEKLKNFRLLHLKGRRCEIGPCKNCDYLKTKGEVSHHQLDPVKDKLLNIYQ